MLREFDVFESILLEFSKQLWISKEVNIYSKVIRFNKIVKANKNYLSIKRNTIYESE